MVEKVQAQKLQTYWMGIKGFTSSYGMYWLYTFAQLPFLAAVLA